MPKAGERDCCAFFCASLCFFLASTSPIMLSESEGDEDISSSMDEWEEDCLAICEVRISGYVPILSMIYACI